MYIFGKQGKRHIIPLIFQSNSPTTHVIFRNYISIKICYQMVNFTRKISLIFELICSTYQPLSLVAYLKMGGHIC